MDTSVVVALLNVLGSHLMTRFLVLLLLILETLDVADLGHNVKFVVKRAILLLTAFIIWITPFRAVTLHDG